MIIAEIYLAQLVNKWERIGPGTTSRYDPNLLYRHQMVRGEIVLSM